MPVLFLLSSAGSIWQASESSELEEPTLICQLMKMDGKAGAESKAPVLDPTPVISWVKSDKDLKGVLVCVHGLGLHKESYQAFGEKMAELGYAVYSMDVRGFGEFQQMPGERKCDFEKCLADVCEGLKVARAMHPGLPVFILGESMGGAIAMRVTEEHPELMDGLISSVPGAKRYGQTKSALQVGMKLLTGSKVDVSKTVVNQSTENEELRKAWLNDKLARFVLTPVELMQFQHFMDSNEKNAHKISQTPVLMVQGVQDHLVKKDDNESIFQHIPAQDKALVFVDGAEHLIFEEGQFKNDAITVLCAWLKDHIKGSSEISGKSGEAISER